MNTQEIQEMAIDGTRVYLEYLEKHKKGESTIQITEISKDEKEDNFQFKVNNRILSPETIFFRYKPTGAEIEADEIEIMSCDNEKGILHVRQTKPCSLKIESIRPQDILVVSDLKFLVKRLKKFFENNGRRITFPDQGIAKNNNHSQFCFLPGCTPNEDQNLALRSIFQNPLLYVWGPPGTGKTRFILSYALLKYIEEGKRVALFAPTNNALEQVLEGILEITDQKGISHEDILRIGVPSQKFLEKYPKVCETENVDQKIDHIETRLSQIEILLDQEKVIRDKENIEYLVENEDKIRNLQKKQNILKESNQRLLSSLKEKEELLHRESKKDNLEREMLRDTEEKIASPFRKIISFFSSDSLEQLRIRRKELEESILGREIIMEKERELQNTQKDCLKNQLIKIENKESKIKACLEKTQNIVFQSNTLRNCMNDEDKKRDVILQRVIEKYNEIKKERDSRGSIILQNDLEREKEELQKKIEHLHSLSTENRIQKVKIAGMTLDAHIGRFPDGNLSFDHYFLDEAGYANVAKVLPLFVYGKPIAFLGDHMQLPPVCEMDMRKIDEGQKNAFLWEQSAIFVGQLFEKNKDECHRFFKNEERNIPSNTHKADLKKRIVLGKNSRKFWKNIFIKMVLAPQKMKILKYTLYTQTEGDL